MKIYSLKLAYFSFLFTLFSISFFVFNARGVNAATLYFSPSSGSFTVGNILTTNILVNTEGQAINNSDVIINFPTNLLEVVSISRSSSIFSLWVEEPAFSNSAGTISLNGGLPTPGFNGTAGKIISVVFRAKNIGPASLIFSSGAVRANDGHGTDILRNRIPAQFNLVAVETPPRVIPPEAPIRVAPPGTAPLVRGPEAPKISSPTHPDQTKWYASNTPAFSWDLPDGALEARTSIGRSPAGTPTVAHIPAISERAVPELQDGTYYFSLRVRTAAGWSAISRYRVNIDTTSPKPFSITFPRGDTGQEPQPVVLFSTTDDMSGISHYNIQIGIDAKPVRFIPQMQPDPYTLPAQSPGTYTLTVTAVDNAGNVRASSSEFTIEAIDTPTITYFPEILNEGDIIKIKGTTYPDSDVTVLIRKGNTLVSEEFTKSNLLGDFELTVVRKLESGIYAFTARVRDSRGAQSMETSPLTISIRSVVIEDIKNFIFKYLPVAILIILSLGALIWISARLWFKIPRSVARMRREAWEAEVVSERSFKILRDGISRHIVRLKKVNRKLTKEEIAFLQDFGEKLTEAEKVIIKEVRDISQS